MITNDAVALAVFAICAGLTFEQESYDYYKGQSAYDVKTRISLKGNYVVTVVADYEETDYPRCETKREYTISPEGELLNTCYVD